MKKSMLAAQLVRYNARLEIRPVGVPKPRGENVLVKIAGAGLCHSDLYLIDGKNKIATDFPLTLGHENAGHVEAVGEDVTSFKTGDPVVVFGGWSSSPNRFTLAGEEQLGDRSGWAGIGKPGGFAEYLLVPNHRYLVPIGNVDPVEAATLADCGLTSYRAIRKIAPRVTAGDHVVLIGIGGIGLYGVQYCKLLCQSRVIAVDIDDSKLKLAKEFGAEFVINSKKENVGERINAITSGEGAFGVIDFVGSDETLDLAYRVAAKRAKVVIVGLGGGTLRYETKHRMNEIEVTTSLWGSMPELKSVVEIARLGLTRARVLKIGFEEINEAFQRMSNGQSTGRTVLVPNP
ncbi:MAG: zinc-binding dehydrogenase [Thaumarchaeota archaeon]|nr:zinc-binding dehydrogenase [Nitrososphaerota archaeon]